MLHFGECSQYMKRIVVMIRNLHGNQLTGSISPALQQLTNLTLLWAYFQILWMLFQMQRVPIYWLLHEDSRCSTHQIIVVLTRNLAFNNFTGSVPEEIGMIVNLDILWVDALPFATLKIRLLLHLRCIGRKSYLSNSCIAFLHFLASCRMHLSFNSINVSFVDCHLRWSFEAVHCIGLLISVSVQKFVEEQSNWTNTSFNFESRASAWNVR